MKKNTIILKAVQNLSVKTSRSLTLKKGLDLALKAGRNLAVADCLGIGTLTVGVAQGQAPTTPHAVAPNPMGSAQIDKHCALEDYHYVPSPENLKARETFQDRKFGIFLHWGLYSMLAQGEWYMNRGIDHEEYRKMAGAFYPAGFNAEEWVKAIKAAGAGYLCFTTRHHEGFSMWDTDCSDYNIVDATPFGRDVLRELADACHKHGLGLHLYYSHLDWDREDYFPLGRTGRKTGRDSHGRWEDYYDFMNCQIEELLTRYGQVDAIWFDGWWDHDQDSAFDWQLPYQYDRIHRLQPACLIGNNHHQVPFPGEDIQIFERDLPGENTAGLSGQDISHLPLETCQTMNGMWGYKIADQAYKDTRTLIHYLVRTAGKDANLLLNIGPQPDGRLPQTALDRLSEIGEWMKVFGPTVVGTRGGEMSDRDWGVMTRKGNLRFVHILDCKDEVLFVPLDGNAGDAASAGVGAAGAGSGVRADRKAAGATIDATGAESAEVGEARTAGAGEKAGSRKIKAARVYATGEKVKFRHVANGIVLELGKVPTEIDYVIELTL